MWLLPLLLACSGDPAPADPAGSGGAPDARPPDARPPDIVLVAVDTLRADHLGMYGYERPTSPALDALAAKGTRFDRAYAQSGWTLASFTSLMSGLYPHQHRVGRDPYDLARFGRLPDERTTLAEALGARGYRTAAFVSNTFVAPEFKLNQGFDTYDFVGATNSEHRPVDEAVADGLAWLESGEEPAFLWLHIMEPHLDYAPPAEMAGRKVKGSFWSEPHPARFEATGGVVQGFGAVGAGRAAIPEQELAYAVARYDEEILAADAALAEFIDALAARPEWSNTLFVFTSDHGEEFQEHGGFEHGHALYGELTRVPLFVVGPGVPEGQQVSTVVEHVDLFQGLIAAAGAESPDGTEGEDLLQIARERPAQTGRTAISENCLYGAPCISLVSDTHRVVFDQHRKAAEVWAVADDASELERLQGEAQLEVGRTLLGQLDQRRGGLDPVTAVAGPQVPSFETFQQLGALGYLDDLPPEQAPSEGAPAEEGAPVKDDAAP